MAQDPGRSRWRDDYDDYRVLPWLAPLRVSRGWTQRDLAGRAGVCWATIRCLEAGRAGRLPTARRLAAAFALPVAALTAPADLLVETGLGLDADRYRRRLPPYGWKSRWGA